MKLHYSVMLFASLASSLCAADQLAAPQPSVADAQSSDLYVQFEYALADLASATYELINLQRTMQNHPYLEFTKEQLLTLNALDSLFYKQGGYDAVVRIFKFNKEDGINAAIAFFKKIANLIDLSLPSSASLMTDQQKLDWLKAADKSIKKKYKSFKPQLKAEELGSSIKKAIIFNPITRHIPLAELAKLLSSEYSRIAQAALTAYYANKYGKKDNSAVKQTVSDRTYDAAIAANKTPQQAILEAQQAVANLSSGNQNSGYFNAVFSKQNLSTTGAVLTVQVLNQMLSDYLTSLAETKKKFEERERFVRTSEDEKKIKEQLHRLVSHAGNGPGFSEIKGIQDEATIKDLTFFADWLKHPISYFGSKLAIMLYGEPGNGKGIITKALSDEAKTPLITISADDVQKRQIGTKLWAAAKIAENNDQKAVIVFFDEIDLIIPQKDKAALQSFLTFLDGTQKGNPHVRILYIFATNHIEKLDPRMLRPGRFKSKIYVGPPSLEQRAKLIEMSLLSVFKTAPKELVEKLAAETDGLSRVAIDEAIENTYNHAALTEETPSVESFIDEIKKLKQVTYHSTKQIA